MTDTPSAEGCSLNADIRTPIASDATRRRVSTALWGAHGLENSIPLAVGPAHERYFRYYTDQSAQALSDRGRHATARTHQDVADVAVWIHQGLERAEILRLLRENLVSRKLTPEEKALHGTVDLTARLMLMMEVGTLECSFTGGTNVDWKAGTLRECVESHFESLPVLSDKFRLEKLFTARNLVRIAGLEIVWTDNLVDHLRLTDDDRKVSIFHHVTFLETHASSLIDPEVVSETLRTLALLFPQSDPATRKWLQKVQLREGLDPGILASGSLRAESRRADAFRCWQDRLSVLKQAFDDGEPSTISQWWHDRRKRVQWYTFWVAIWVLLLTVFFGLVQSIEGALQVYQAFKPAS